MYMFNSDLQFNINLIYVSITQRTAHTSDENHSFLNYFSILSQVHIRDCMQGVYDIRKLLE